MLLLIALRSECVGVIIQANNCPKAGGVFFLAT